MQVANRLLIKGLAGMLDGSCELLAVGNVQYLLFMADCRRTLSFSKPWLRLETVKRFQLQVVRLWNIRCELWLDIIAIVTIHLLWKSWYYIIWDWAHCCSAYLYLVLCYFCRTERYNVNMFAFQRNKLWQYNLQIALLEIRMMVIYYHFYEIPVWKKPPPKLIIESAIFFIFIQKRKCSIPPFTRWYENIFHTTKYFPLLLNRLLPLFIADE